MPTEADTCRKLVVPKLQAAGWDNEPHSIAEQRWFTQGRIVVHGNQATRRRGKRADYLLRYTRDFPIAVVEAKAEYKKAADGLQQPKEYGGILSLRFAYATNGEEIIEFDFITGLERTRPDCPTPAKLWSRLRAAEKLTDDDLDHQSELLGEDLFSTLQDVYLREAKFCVLLASRHYQRSDWAWFESRHILRKAIAQRTAFALPVRIDDSTLAGLPDSIAYLDLRKHSVEEVAEFIASKVACPEPK